MPTREPTHHDDKDTAKQRITQLEGHESVAFTPQAEHPAAILRRVALDPQQMTAQDAQRLQRTIGNRAVNRLIQTKLNVGAADDAYEQEADRVAVQVMQTTGDRSQGERGKPAANSPARVADISRAPAATAGQIQRVMTVAALKRGAGEPSGRPLADRPYKKLIKKLEQYFNRRLGTTARGEQSEWLHILRDLAQKAHDATDQPQRQGGLQRFIVSIDREIGQMQEGMTGQNWRAELLDPTQANAWQVTPDTWKEKTSLGQQFSSDAALWYSTLFGDPNAAGANAAEQRREQAQQDIMKRMFLTMASAGVESRAGTTSGGETLPALPGAAGQPEDWGEFSFPLAAAMSHGRRAQMQFGVGTQAHKHEGWEWLVSGHAGATQAGQRGVSTFSGGNRILNTIAGMHSRTSTHSAGAEGEKKYSGAGALKGVRDIPGQTAGMDVAFGGRGAPLPQDMIAGGANPVVGERGQFAIRPGARDIKGKVIKEGETGQHGHMLMRPKNIKTDAGKMSNVLVSMEDTAAGAYGLSGHPHTASAAPETTTVTGQTQWTHMAGVGLTRGLSAAELARVPRGYDALRARVQSREQFQSIQGITDKILRDLPPNLQKLLFRHLLVSDAGRARQIMGALIGLAGNPTVDWLTAARAYLESLPAPQH